MSNRVLEPLLNHQANITSEQTFCDWCGQQVNPDTAMKVNWILHGWLEVERHYCNEKCFREREGC